MGRNLFASRAGNSSDNEFQEDAASTSSIASDAQPSSRRQPLKKARRKSYTKRPQKRRRAVSLDVSGIRRYELEGKYKDAYRLLFNEHVESAATRFSLDEYTQRYNFQTQIGTSIWSSTEKGTFFAALERLGRDDIPGIAAAVATKSASETRDFLLFLSDASIKHNKTEVTLKDIPAATDIGRECDVRMEEAADALAWFQERAEARREQDTYGDYWLITPQIAEEMQTCIDNTNSTRATSSPTPHAPISQASGRTTPGYDFDCLFSLVHVANCMVVPVPCVRSGRENAIVKHLVAHVFGLIWSVYTLQRFSKRA